MRLYRPLLLVSILLALAVVCLGAYVRLSDAGLGCPDWPGCYGHLLGVPQTDSEQATALQVYPGKPVEAGKAWKEMTHRYFAGTLGLLVLALLAMSWKYRVARMTTTLLATTVVFQALLGMWTVTLLLKPVIVTGHLLGGMSTLALLVWLAQRKTAWHPGAHSDGPNLLALAGLAVLFVQIALGGWVSSNYAALACNEFPACLDGAWMPAMDFEHAFTLHRELGQTGAGGLLPFAALTAIHWVHRLGALLVFLVLGVLALRLGRSSAWRVDGLVLGALLCFQVGLGIANILLSLPIAIAVAHNFGAALLVVALVTINARLWR